MSCPPKGVERTARVASTRQALRWRPRSGGGEPNLSFVGIVGLVTGAVRAHQTNARRSFRVMGRAKPGDTLHADVTSTNGKRSKSERAKWRNKLRSLIVNPTPMMPTESAMVRIFSCAEMCKQRLLYGNAVRGPLTPGHKPAPEKSGRARPPKKVALVVCTRRLLKIRNAILQTKTPWQSA